MPDDADGGRLGGGGGGGGGQAAAGAHRSEPTSHVAVRASPGSAATSEARSESSRPSQQTTAVPLRRGGRNRRRPEKTAGAVGYMFVPGVTAYRAVTDVVLDAAVTVTVFFLPQGRGDVNMECYSFVKHDILFTGRVVRVAALVEPRLV